MISSNDRRSMRHKAGRRLRRLRVDKGIRTTAELSEELRERFGVDVSSELLHALETGDGECGIDIWMLLCNLYSVGLDEITQGLVLRRDLDGRK